MPHYSHSTGRKPPRSWHGDTEARRAEEADQRPVQPPQQEPAPTKPFCCFIGCDEDAEWEIVRQDTSHPSDGFTQACSDHVGQLLDDGFQHAVYPTFTDDF